MKILYVTASMPYGDGETFLVPEAKAILNTSSDLLIVPRSPSSNRVVNADAQDLYKISLHKPLISASIIMASISEFLRSPGRCITAFGLLLQDKKAGTLLRNLAVFPKGLWLGRLARSGRFDHIHVHWATTTATMAMLASAVSEVPWSFTAHRGDIAANNLLALKARRASFIRFISKSGLKMAQSLGAECPSGKTHVVHMGVDCPEIEPHAPPMGKAVRLICPAHLYPVKGHEYLLLAIQILVSRGVTCKLIVAGEGFLKQTLKDRVAQLGIEDVVDFRGHISHDTILGMYRDKLVDMVILPSVDLGNNIHEGIPVSLIEAMSWGIPTISTSTGGIPELMAGGAGFMVPPANAEAIADAVEALASNAHLRQEQSTAGSKRVAEEYDMRIVAKRLVFLFENSLQEQAARKPLV